MKTRQKLLAGGAMFVLSPVLLAVAVGGGAAAMLAGTSVEPPAPAAGAIPASMLRLYHRATGACPGLPWSVLAAIGTVESDNGRSDAPGVHSGANSAGAEGPMQFEPATFAEYALPVPAGGARPPSPYDPVDAVVAAARYLCASGATRPGGLPGAVFQYNHSAAYVAEVLALAQRYAAAPGLLGTGAAAVALAWALAQVGTPYLWGGETPGVGFDCSGLVQAAYAAAGIALPRVAQEQYDAGPRLAPGSTLEPGDLLFFSAPGAGIVHVGMFVGVEGGVPLMVDAPHTGATVRVEPCPTVAGVSWGGEVFAGATDPAEPG